MRRPCLAALHTVLALASCAAAGPWVKDGATDDEVEVAAADCGFEAQGASLAEKARAPENEWFIGVAPGGRRFTFRLPGEEPLRFLRQRELFVRCKEDAGYTREPSSEPE